MAVMASRDLERGYRIGTGKPGALLVSPERRWRASVIPSAASGAGITRK
jgi:hypothetical protein